MGENKKKMAFRETVGKSLKKKNKARRVLAMWPWLLSLNPPPCRDSRMEGSDELGGC
jgi:hypothetical protein